MPEEWKNSFDKPVYKKSNEESVKNNREICLLSGYFKLSSKGLNEKLNVQAEQFLLECQNGFKRAYLASIHYLV